MAADGKVVIETGIDTDGFEKGVERLDRINARMVNRLEKTAQKTKSAFSSAFAGVGNAAEKPFEKVRKTASDKFASINKSFQKFKTQAAASLGGMLGIDDKTNKSTKSILDMLKGIQKHAKRGRRSLLKMIATSILMSSVFSALNQVTQRFGESFNAMAQASSTVNNDMSSVTSSLKTLSNSLASAFAPILHVAAPALTALINLLSRAVTAIGMFFAALTGQKTFEKAVPIQEDYAESLGDTAAAAKAAKKELDNLSGLDEINKWQSPADTSGAGGTAAATSPEDMFQAVEVPNKFADLAAMVKEAWKNADFTDIGSIIATKLRHALEKVPWKKIKGGSKKFAKSASTLINGFFSDSALFSEVGKTVAESINTSISTAGTFLRNLDWQGVGSAITTTLYSALKNLDLSTLGDVVLGLALGILGLITGALKGVDWSSVPSTIASSIEEFASSIKPEDYQELATAVGEAIGAALSAVVDLSDAIHKLLADGIVKGVKGIKDYFMRYINEALSGLDEDAGLLEKGAAIISGIKKGIYDALARIGVWIYNNVIKPFVDGFKNGFGIDSSGSSVTREHGNKIIDSLLGGIKSKISKVGEIFSQIKNTISEKLTAAKTSVTNIANNIKNVLSSAWTNVKDKTVNMFASMKTSVTNILSNLRSAIKTPINGIIGFLNSMISGITSGINSAIRALNRINIKIPSWVPGIGGNRFGFNISTITAPKIPYLATGAVIPPNAPFTAVLGDQRNGTNLEAPESLIRQIVREESGGAGDTFNVRAIANGRAIFDLVIEEGKQRQAQTGRNPFVLQY